MKCPYPSDFSVGKSKGCFWFWLVLAAFTGAVQSQPVITSAPTNQIVLIAGDAFFQVDITGQGPFRYQWRFNGTNLPSDFITTLAGNGTADYGGDGVSASRTSLNWPFGVTVDSQRSVYIADYANNRVRRVDPNRIISTVAGNGAGAYGGDGAEATNASLFNPAGVTLDGSGNLYIADYSNHRVRRVDTNGIITTVAGNGTGTYAGDGSAATNASLQNPFGLAFDTGGNLYIADSGNDRIRRVDVNGMISTVAGGGLIDFGAGTMATNAGLVYPTGVAVDPLGNLFIADNNDNRVCKVDTTGFITRYAGTGGNFYSGDGGPAVDAGISYPRGLTTDALGNLYIAVFYDNRIRKVDTNGIITTLVGTGDSTYNGDNISATNASLFYPQGVALDNRGALYIADFQNNRVRMVATPGPVLKLTNITTNNDGVYDVIVSNDSGSITSSLARLEVALPPGIAVQPQTQQILLGTSVAFSVQPSGTPPFSYQWQFNGTDITNATAAQYTIPTASTNDAGSYTVLVTSPYGSITSAAATLTVLLPPFISVQPVDQTAVLGGGSATFSVSVTGPGPYRYQWRLNGTNLPTDIITTFAGKASAGFSGDLGPATNASLRSPIGVAFDAAGNLFIADTSNNRIRKVDTNGIISTVAGKGSLGPPGDGGAATNASVVTPNGVAVDGAGNVFIAETGNSHIRKVRTDGTIISVAGTAFFGFSGDGGAATNASLHNPQGVAIDSFGNLLIADTGNNRIREIRPDGIIMTVAGRGSIGPLGDGGAATNASLNGPTGICVDSAGNWFIADMNNSRIRKVDTNGLISTVAGKSAFSFSGDGGAATNASLNHPVGVSVDRRGNLFIADSGNNRVREVTTDGVINSVAGQATAGFSGDGGPAALASLNYPTAAAVAGADRVFVADSNNSRIRTVTVAGPELTLDQITPAIAGAYDVVVANANGSVTSHVATLTVTVPFLPPLSISLIGDSQIQLQLNTTPGDSLILQSATNLAPPIFWENLLTNLADSNGNWMFTSPVPQPAVFYRVKKSF